MSSKKRRAAEAAAVASSVATSGGSEFDERDPVSLFRCLALQGVVRENHAGSINDLAFCRVHAPFANLVADVAGTQANVYRVPADAETVDSFMHFLNDGPFPARAAAAAVDLTLLACAWIVLRDADSPDATHSARDAWLAVAGADCTVHVLSLALGRELFQLAGHADAVVALESCAGVRELLLSLSAAGEVRVWNVGTRACVAVYASDATCIALSPDGTTFYTGHRHGAVRTWRVPVAAVDTQTCTDDDALATVALPQRVGALRAARGAVVALDRRPALSVLTAAADRHDVDSDATVVARHVHHWWSVPSVTEQCNLDVSPDGARVLLGDAAGDLTLFSAVTGLPLALKKAQSRSIALRRAQWSHDGRGVVCVGDGPFVWRWKFMHPSVRSELDDEFKQTLAMRELEQKVRAERPGE
jgi:hypothetical protein